MGWRMSLKVHILDAHLDKFKKKMRGSKLSFTRIYWTLNIDTKDSVMKTWGTMFKCLYKNDLQFGQKSRKSTHF